MRIKVDIKIACFTDNAPIFDSDMLLKIDMFKLLFIFVQYFLISVLNTNFETKCLFDEMFDRLPLKCQFLSVRRKDVPKCFLNVPKNMIFEVQRLNDRLYLHLFLL